MADLKISQLTDGGNSQATDEYVIARSGANYRIDGASVAAAATSVGTLSSLTVSGDLTVDTSTLKVDSANNRVGIGTASPAAPLHVSADRVFVSADVGRVSLGPNNSSGDAHVGSSGLPSPAVGSQDYGYYVAHNAFRDSTGAWKHSRTTSIPAVRHLGSGGVSSGTAGFYWDYSANVGTSDISWTNLMQLSVGGQLSLGAGSGTATPQATSISAPSGGGTDIAGAALTIQGGRGTGSGAGGAILFSTSAAGASGTTLRTATERMRVDANGDVQIGTTSRIYLSRLSVAYDAGSQNGPISADTRSFSIGRGGAFYLGGKYNTAGDYRAYAGIVGLKENATDGNSAGYLRFDTNANAADPAERMRLDSAGNLGLGVTPSAWASTFKAIQINTGGGWMADPANSYFSQNSFWNGTNWIRQTNNPAARHQMENGVHSWHIAPTGTAGNAITFTQAMTLDASGNLGLATTSVDATAWGSTYPKLAIGTTTNAGILQFQSTAANADGKFLGGISPLNLASGVTAVESAGIWFYQQGTSATTPGSNIRFATRTDAGSLAERARITSAGELLVGTTTQRSNAIVKIRDLVIVPSNNDSYFQQFDITKAALDGLANNTDYNLFTASIPNAAGYTQGVAFAGQLFIAVHWVDSGGGQRSHQLIYDIGLGGTNGGNLTWQSNQVRDYIVQNGGATTDTITLSAVSVSTTSATIAIKIAGGTYTVSGSNQISARLIGTATSFNTTQKLSITVA